MAEAYHNEALRKQRIIDKAAEARKRIEKEQKVYTAAINKFIQALYCLSNKHNIKCSNHKIKYIYVTVSEKT